MRQTDHQLLRGNFSRPAQEELAESSGVLDLPKHRLHDGLRAAYDLRPASFHSFSWPFDRHRVSTKRLEIQADSGQDERGPILLIEARGNFLQRSIAMRPSWLATPPSMTVHPHRAFGRPHREDVCRSGKSRRAIHPLLASKRQRAIFHYGMSTWISTSIKKMVRGNVQETPMPNWPTGSQGAP